MMRWRVLLCITLLLCLGVGLSADATSSPVLQHDWASYYSGGDAYDFRPKALAVDPAGDVCVVGIDGYPGYPNWVVVKYRGATGEQLWINRFTRPNEIGGAPNAITVDAFGHFYVTGYSDNTGGTQSDVRTVKYHGGTGARLWVANYTGPGKVDDWGTTIALDGNGSVYVAGGAHAFQGSADFIVLKYDAGTGAQLWMRTYNGTAQGQDYVAG